MAESSSLMESKCIKISISEHHTHNEEFIFLSILKIIKNLSAKLNRHFLLDLD